MNSQIKTAVGILVFLAVAFLAGQAQAWTLVQNEGYAPLLVNHSAGQSDPSAPRTMLAVGCEKTGAYGTMLYAHPNVDTPIEIRRAFGTLPKTWRSTTGLGAMVNGIFYPRASDLIADFAAMDDLRELTIEYTIEGETLNQIAVFLSNDGWQRGYELIAACQAYYAETSDQPAATPVAGQHGDTPLHAAIRRGDEADARRILASATPATLCARNGLNQTPAQLARIIDLSEIVWLLSTLDATHGCD